MVEKCFRCLYNTIHHTTLYHIVLLHNVYSTERALLSLVINFHKLLSVNYAKFSVRTKVTLYKYNMVCVRVYFSHFSAFSPFFSRTFSHSQIISGTGCTKPFFFWYGFTRIWASFYTLYYSMSALSPCLGIRVNRKGKIEKKKWRIF